MGGLNVTDVRRERIPLLRSTVGETTLAKGFCSNMGDTKYPCVCRRTTFLAMEHKNRRTTFLAMEHKNKRTTFLAMEHKNKRITFLAID